MLVCQGALVGRHGRRGHFANAGLPVHRPILCGPLDWVGCSRDAFDGGLCVIKAFKQTGSLPFDLVGPFHPRVGFYGADEPISYEAIPLPVLLMLVLAAVLAMVAAHTPFGRHLYAIGGNKEAAFYSGINIHIRIVQVFALMGALAGVAGIVLTARVGSATSDAGRMMELDAIAAAVIGGTSLLGGRGTVWGALLGGLVMASLDNGMSLMNTEAFWQPILKGAILVSAVGMDMVSRNAGKRV
jgi:D-xylose transport system permease protein